MNLTTKEKELYDSVLTGMDEAGCGWLHELAPANWSPRSAAGVLSSLIRKGLVHSHKDPETNTYWITLVN
jgi:predicted transcriptional regulator